MQFELDKETQKIQFTLSKSNLQNITAEVVAVLDVSGSMQGLFRSGAVQTALQRVVPIAINFDDNGEIPVYLFSSTTKLIDNTLSADNYVDFVEVELSRQADWGGTVLTPAIQQVVEDLGFTKNVPDFSIKNLFKKFIGKPANPLGGYSASSKTGLPAIVYIFTDGENTDPLETEDILANLADSNSEIYFNFIGIGYTKFKFLENTADRFPNVGFCKVRDLAGAADSDAIYQALLPAELRKWLGRFISAM